MNAHRRSSPVGLVRNLMLVVLLAGLAGISIATPGCSTRRGPDVALKCAGKGDRCRRNSDCYFGLYCDAFVGKCKPFARELSAREIDAAEQSTARVWSVTTITGSARPGDRPDPAPAVPARSTRCARGRPTLSQLGLLAAANSCQPNSRVRARKKPGPRPSFERPVDLGRRFSGSHHAWLGADELRAADRLLAGDGEPFRAVAA